MAAVKRLVRVSFTQDDAHCRNAPSNIGTGRRRNDASCSMGVGRGLDNRGCSGSRSTSGVSTTGSGSFIWRYRSRRGSMIRCHAQLAKLFFHATGTKARDRSFNGSCIQGSWTRTVDIRLQLADEWKTRYVSRHVLCRANQDGQKETTTDQRKKNEESWGIHNDFWPENYANGNGASNGSTAGGNGAHDYSMNYGDDEKVAQFSNGFKADENVDGSGSEYEEDWLSSARDRISSTLDHDTEYLESWEFWRRKWRSLQRTEGIGKGNGNTGTRKTGERVSKSSIVVRDTTGSSSGSWFGLRGSRRNVIGRNGAKDEDAYGFWSDFDSTSAPEFFINEPELFHSRPKDLLQVITAVVVGPLVVSTIARFFIIEPLLERHSKLDASAFQITSSQRLEVARRVEDWERGIRYEQLMGRMPKLGEAKLEEQLRDEAEKFENEARRRNVSAIGNVVTDVTLASVISAGILVNKRQLVSFRERLGRLFFGLGASQQAVFILLVADILVGYHSSDGWVAFISLCLEHYGISPQGNEAFVSLFVATVPVLLDVAFKYWVFSKLRRLSPSTQVILDELERH